MFPSSYLVARASPGIAQVGARLARVHGALVRWLRREPELAARAGGPLFLRARVVAPAALPAGAGFDFDYYDGRLLISPAFLAAWAALLARVGEPRFAEVVRLFLLHEGHHIGQGMGYSSQGVGRAGVALEAADYDADVASVEACLGWRRRHVPAALRRQGEMGALCDVLDSLLLGLGLFDGEGPLRLLKERRLRRYLVWHLQRARARAAPPDLPAERLRLRERVVVEAPGLRGACAAEPGADPVLDLERLDEAGDLEIVLYTGGRLYRCRDQRFCRDLLGALRDGGAQVSRVFRLLFEEYPGLVPG